MSFSAFTINTPGSMTTQEVTSDENMSVNYAYIANDSSAITFTLPAASTIDDVIEIWGKGSGGWDIAQGAGQTIHYGSTSSTTGAGGSVASTIQYQVIKMRCITADTDWEIMTSNATLTIT